MCGSRRIVPVVWGLVPFDGLVANGEVIVGGGCRIPPNPARWGCADCNWWQTPPSPDPEPGSVGPGQSTR